jgi:hypothetical protein
MPEEKRVCCACTGRRSSHQTGTSTLLLAEGLILCHACGSLHMQNGSLQWQIQSARRLQEAPCGSSSLRHCRWTHGCRTTPRASNVDAAARCTATHATHQMRRAMRPAAVIRQTVHSILLRMHPALQHGAHDIKCMRIRTTDSSEWQHLLRSTSGTPQQQHSCHNHRQSTASWQQQRTERTQHAAGW